MLKEARYYAKMAAVLPRWTRASLEADPRALLQRNIQNRARNFLALARAGIFDNPTNPYDSLFRWAGCEFGDLEALVNRQGLEPALEHLRQAGVYLTHDEFKGKTVVRRGGQSLQSDPAAYANPTIDPVFEGASSGSRGRPVRTRSSLENQAYREAQERVLFHDYESEGRCQVMLAHILPARDGLRRVVDYGRRGRQWDKWFAIAGSFQTSGHYRLITQALLWELRLLGLPTILPEYLPHNDFSPVARWIAQRKCEGKLSFVSAGVSRGVRVAAAAMELGLDIAGTLFCVGGEAFTDAKRAVMESAGCEAHARYNIAEVGRVGIGCRGMKGNCVHVCLDGVAVISRRRTAPLTDMEVDSLMFTPLLPSASTVTVNLEMDDAGIVGPAACGCKLTDLGLNQQIDKIYSYGKLTGHGTTLLSGDLFRILEKSLPARFGGVSGDFQLVECEGVGQTDIELRVSPRVNVSSREIREYFLTEIKSLWGGALTQRMWVQSESVRVVVAEPYVTGTRGKVHLLHLLGNR